METVLSRGRTVLRGLILDQAALLTILARPNSALAPSRSAHATPHHDKLDSDHPFGAPVELLRTLRHAAGLAARWRAGGLTGLSRGIVQRRERRTHRAVRSNPQCSRIPPASTHSVPGRPEKMGEWARSAPHARRRQAAEGHFCAH